MVDGPRLRWVWLVVWMEPRERWDWLGGMDGPRLRCGGVD